MVLLLMKLYLRALSRLQTYGIKCWTHTEDGILASAQLMANLFDCSMIRFSLCSADFWEKDIRCSNKNNKVPSSQCTVPAVASGAKQRKILVCKHILSFWSYKPRFILSCMKHFAAQMEFRWELGRNALCKIHSSWGSHDSWYFGGICWIPQAETARRGRD